MRCDHEVGAQVYIALNLVNGKKYIGVTSHKRLQRRVNEHFSIAKKGFPYVFCKAIRKYGRENFTFTTVRTFSNCDAALAEEIRLIKVLKPEYNLTLGGQGNFGHIVTDAQKKRLVEVHTGNKYRVGMTHTDEVKELLSKLATKQGNFKKFGHLGPLSVRRKVRCLADGKEFLSIVETARFYGVSKSHLNMHLLKYKGHNSVRGMIFEFVGEE